MHVCPRRAWDLWNSVPPVVPSRTFVVSIFRWVQEMIHKLQANLERTSNRGRLSDRRLCNLYQCGQSSGDYTDSRCSWCAYFTGKIIWGSVFTRCEKSQLITGWRRDSPPFASYDMCVQYSERRGVLPRRCKAMILVSLQNMKILSICHLIPE